MAKPKPLTTPASRARTQVRAQARDTMRQRAANTGAKPRLAAGVKPGTPVATGKGPLQKNTMSGKPKSGGRIVPPSPPKGPGRGPQLPNVPSKGTTNTIRATGGNSKYAKINRLSGQTRAITGSRALAPVARSARAAGAMRDARTFANSAARGAGSVLRSGAAAMRGADKLAARYGGGASKLAGRAGAIGVGANLFAQGKSGSVVDQAVKKLPGIKANPKTDLGKRAGDAISRTASQAAAALKKQLKKAKMGY